MDESHIHSTKSKKPNTKDYPLIPFIQSLKTGKPVFGVINQDSGDSLGIVTGRGTNGAPKCKNVKGPFS